MKCVSNILLYNGVRTLRGVRTLHLGFDVWYHLKINAHYIKLNVILNGYTYSVYIVKGDSVTHFVLMVALVPRHFMIFGKKFGEYWV